MSKKKTPPPSGRVSRPELPKQHVHALIVGAGFAGLGSAIKLDGAGHHDFLVIDKGSEVGGTWRDNTYPGAACDVPSQLYSFSFAPNPNWSRSFSPQPEIQAYLRNVAEQAGVLDRFVFNTSVEDMVWDDQDNVWQVTTTAGDVTADVVISGAGGLSEPKLPEIKGIDDFAGEIFHSARWNHEYDVTGKRIAIIGTGASAIQIVPEVARQAAQLDVYQRTAPWVMPRNDRAYTRLEKLGFKAIPGLQKAYRTGIYWTLESRVPMFTGLLPQIRIPATLMAKQNIARGISDLSLREAVTPDFEIGCKRILISNTYYPALARDNVSLVTDGILEITSTGVVTADGTHREVDAIIVATGFHTTEQPIAQHVKGRDGRTLADAWSENGMAAYKGTTINGFPNLFQIVGPNTGLSHTSMVFMIESQVAYVTSALDVMKGQGLATIEPTAEAQAAWNDDLQRRMKKTVWNSGGCASWYLDEHGKNTILWPRNTFTFRQLLAKFDPSQYLITTATTHLEIKEPVA